MTNPDKPKVDELEEILDKVWAAGNDYATTIEKGNGLDALRLANHQDRNVLPKAIAQLQKLIQAARVDELEKFSHSSGSLHLLVEEVSYKPEGHHPATTWPILKAPGGLIIVMRSYIKDRLATLNQSEDKEQS